MKWTAEQFWEYVEGLTDDFKAGQMRDMLAECGLVVSAPTPKKGFAFPDIVIDWQTINAQQFDNSRASIVAKLDQFMERKESAHASSNWYSRDEMYVIQQLLKAATASRSTARGAEPVAWRWATLSDPDDWSTSTKKPSANEWRIVQPLYATPTPSDAMPFCCPKCGARGETDGAATTARETLSGPPHSDAMTGALVALPSSLVGKIVAAMAERAKKAASFAKQECEADLVAVKAWADQADRDRLAPPAQPGDVREALATAYLRGRGIDGPLINDLHEYNGETWANALDEADIVLSVRPNLVLSAPSAAVTDEPNFCGESILRYPRGRTADAQRDAFVAGAEFASAVARKKGNTP